jgi:high-affinity iron transporter
VLQAFVTPFREGLEAFLIVAVSLAFLRKSGRSQLRPAVRWGAAASVPASVLAGVLLSRAAHQALWEGVLALAAAIAASALTIHVGRTARRLEGEIQGRLPSSSVRSGVTSWLAFFLLTVLMMTRQGMETALLLAALIFQVRALDLTAGAVSGLAVAGVLAWLWTRYGYRVHRTLFLQMTAIFLFIFIAQLAMAALHALTDANVLPNSDAIRWATQPFAPDGMYGQYVSYLLLAAPLAWLLAALFFGNGKASDGRVAHVGR